MSGGGSQAALRSLVRDAVNDVLDPCSVGRGVPAGLVDMGMLCDLDVRGCQGGGTHVRATLRLTSPGCGFQLAFDRELRARVGAVEGVRSVEIVWSRSFDWSDDDMSPDLKRRLRRRREELLLGRAARVPTLEGEGCA